MGRFDVNLNPNFILRLSPLARFLRGDLLFCGHGEQQIPHSALKLLTRRELGCGVRMTMLGSGNGHFETDPLSLSP